VEPPRGPRTAAAVDAAGFTFTISLILNLPRAMFGVHYPPWLLWLGRGITIIFLIALLIFVLLRGREVISYRHDRAGHQWAITPGGTGAVPAAHDPRSGL
jgi:hypothetical protein